MSYSPLLRLLGDRTWFLQSSYTPFSVHKSKRIIKASSKEPSCCQLTVFGESLRLQFGRAVVIRGDITVKGGVSIGIQMLVAAPLLVLRLVRIAPVAAVDVETRSHDRVRRIRLETQRSRFPVAQITRRVSQRAFPFSNKKNFDEYQFSELGN